MSAIPTAVNDILLKRMQPAGLDSADVDRLRHAVHEIMNGCTSRDGLRSTRVREGFLVDEWQLPHEIGEPKHETDALSLAAHMIGEADMQLAAQRMLVDAVEESPPSFAALSAAIEAVEPLGEWMEPFTGPHKLAVGMRVRVQGGRNRGRVVRVHRDLAEYVRNLLSEVAIALPASPAPPHL